MRPRLVLSVSIALLLGLPAAALSQQQSGNLYGTVTDNEGSPLPGVRVELTGLGAPRIQFTNAQGEFRFLGLDPGDRQLTASLEGFSTVDYPKIDIRVGRNTTLEVTLSPAVEDVITVTSESPLLDERKISTGTTVSQIELEKIPTARDPWALLQQTPGVLVDRINVGGNESGQQAVFRGPATSDDENAFVVDGVVIADPAVAGGAFAYFNFDAFEELSPTTGGADASLATGGVTFNLVTKRGTNEWRGSARYLLVDGEVWPSNVPAGGHEAEFGGALGGLLNVITKSGGNELQSEIFAHWSDDAVQSEPLVNPSLNLDLEFAEYDFGAALGGKLIQDKLWYFLAANPERSDAGPLVLPGGLFEGVPGGLFDADQDGRPDVRVKWLSSANNGPGVGLATNIPNYLAFTPDGVLPVDLQGTGVFPGSFYLPGLHSTLDGGFRLDPRDAPPSSDPFSPGDGIFFFGFFGDHSTPIELPGGANALPDVDGDGTGDTFLIDPSELGRLCPGLVGGFFRVEEIGGEGGGRLAPDPDAPEIDCVYLQDRIRLNDAFTLNLGVRADAFGGTYPSDRKLDFSFGDMIAPRVGFTWDVAQSGRSRLYGHYGRFYESVPLDFEAFGRNVNPSFWYWGAYDTPDTREDPNDLRTGTYTGILTPNFFLEGQYSERDFTLGGVGSAPLASGIQDGGIEFWSKWSTDIPCGGRCKPGGAYDEDGLEPPAPDPTREPDDVPLVYIVAQGGSTGEVYDVTIVHPPSGPVPLEGLVAIEPVAATAADRARFERELAEAGGTVETVTGAGYCLQFGAKAPPPGTVFRIAPAEKQRGFEPASRALAAARRLHEAGRLSPDTDPESYYHSIRQWAVWTLEQGFERKQFVDAFLEHTRRNVEERGQRWTSEIADIVRRSAEGRWTDVAQVLRDAEASSGS